MELVCFEEEVSPKVDSQAKLFNTPTLRRSQRIQTRNKERAENSDCKRVTSEPTLCQRPKRSKASNSISYLSISPTVDISPPSQYKTTEVTSSGSTESVNKEKSESKPKTKKGGKNKKPIDTESDESETPVRKKRKTPSLIEDKSDNSSRKRKRKQSGASVEDNQIVPEEKKTSKRQSRYQVPESSGSDSNTIDILCSDSSPDQAKKGKGKRSGLREKHKGRKQSRVVHRSVIRCNMSDKNNGDPGPSGEGQKDTPPNQGDQATGGGDPPEGIDPFLSLMNEETKRLQMMLEARGLPPHLLGSLGPRMPHLFSKHMSSSNNSKAQQLLDGLKCIEDESVQLQSCIEIGQLLVMGNEDTLSGFPVKETVPALIHLLSMEHNFDIMMNASRALTYMMEALPRSTVVVADAIPLLLEKLQIIQCMDVAEQALSALDILSKKHSKSILQAGGVNACLLYLDFFSLTTQRSALSVAANCCLSVSEDEFDLVKDSISILAARLHHQDKKSVESCCLCFSRLVDSFVGYPKLLQQIASQGLLPNIQALLVVSPPVISTNMFVTVVKMLSTLCSVCPVMAVELLTLNIAETLKYLLVGSEQLSMENSSEINSRSSNEVFEVVSLISELLPPLPKDGLFEVDKLLTSTARRPLRVTVQWEWQTDSGSWAPYRRAENRFIEAAHIGGEDEVPIDVAGRTYIIEFSAMQQFNEDTGNARAIRRTVIDDTANKDSSPKKVEEADPRQLTLCAEPELCASFMQLLLAVLFKEFNNMAAPSVKHRCLKAILRMLYTALPQILTDVLRDLSVSSYLATMLKSNDYRIVVGAIQMANILIDKLPEIFLVYFHREGVMHVMEILKSVPLKAINTPKKPDQHPEQQPQASLPFSLSNPLHPPPGPPLDPLSFPMSLPQPNAPHVPLQGVTSESPSTARKFADMFRRSRRQLRKSFSRSRSEDVINPPPPPSSSSLPAPSPPVLSMPVIHMPLKPGATPTNTPPSSVVVITTGDDTQQNKPFGEIKTTKEKIRDWIQEQAGLFLDKWSSDTVTDNNPALDVMRKLEATVERMDTKSANCLDAVKELCDLLSNSVTSVSAFELIHCKVLHMLEKFLSSEDTAVPLTVRLKHFSSVFMGLPEKDFELSSWVPQDKPGLVMLLAKLHRCINQIENFPIRVHDTQGKRGSQAMRFFNTHQIKCVLELYPSATGLKNFKGGTVRVDPLATMQAVERYLVLKGVTSSDQKTSEDTEGSDESDSDEGMQLSSIPLGPAKRQLEFLMNDQLVPHNMTVFQAVKTFGLIGSEESEEEMTSFGNPEIWIKSHLIHYRLINQGLRPKRSYSVPATPIGSHTRPKYIHSISIGGGSTGKGGTGATPPAHSNIRVTRSMSKHQQGKREDEEMDETTTDCLSRKLSPLILGIRNLSNNKFSVDDPSLSIIRLMRILHLLNTHWNDLYNGFPGNPIVPVTEFVNFKLTSKASRQLQDPLNVMTGNFPNWLKELAKQCGFLFTFEHRQTFFYLTAFDRDRAILRLQEQQPELSMLESNERITPKLEKKKRCVSREGLLHQAERIMEEVGSSRALLEIQYQDEVGTGLGPTLEFYTLVSREVQQANLQMWRGDPCPLPGSTQATASVPQYIHSPVGLFPAPLAGDTSFSIVEEVCGRFRFLGCFMAKAIMDSRMLDLPLSEAFCMWMLGGEESFTAQDLQHVDPVLSRSFAQLADVAVRKHQLDCDPLLTGKALQVGVESLTLEGGGNIEDLDLDFTLPGYPYIELKPHGKDTPVNIHNLDDYLKLVVDWTLMRGVSRQMDAFREGFNKAFPMSSLQAFYPHEMDILLCGANNQKWDIRELVENCRPDHGYTHDSQAVQFLFQVLSSYNTTEQRHFIQFVTGSPRLPVGGFKALNPPLTVVRKTSEGQNPDHFLPSVMTCVNYLKLPDYSSKEVMKERLDIALREGKNSFHLS